MFAILHFVAVKKSRHANMFALSESVRTEVLFAPASFGPTAQRVGHTYGDEGKAVGWLSADGFAVRRVPASDLTASVFAERFSD
jgi:hypothetical protein